VVRLRVVAERKGERRGVVKMRVFIVDRKEICGGVVDAWISCFCTWRITAGAAAAPRVEGSGSVA
jgi:hypothetical protein